MHCELHKVILNKDNKPASKFPIYNGFNLIDCYNNAMEQIETLDGREALCIEVLGEDTIERIQPSYITTVEDLEYAKGYIKEQLKSYPFIRVSSISTLYSDYVFHVDAYENSEELYDNNSKPKERLRKALNYAIDLFDDAEGDFEPDEFTGIEIRDYVGNTLVMRSTEINSSDLKSVISKL